MLAKCRKVMQYTSFIHQFLVVRSLLYTYICVLYHVLSEYSFSYSVERRQTLSLILWYTMLYLQDYENISISRTPLSAKSCKFAREVQRCHLLLEGARRCASFYKQPMLTSTARMSRSSILIYIYIYTQNKENYTSSSFISDTRSRAWCIELN